MSGLHVPSNPNLLEVPVHALQPGMYVAELDRPWLETPFAVQGFIVQSADDIDYIGKHCDYVYVDPVRKSTRPITEKRFKPRHSDSISIKGEFARAKGEFESASQAMERVFSSIAVNKKVDLEQIRKAINPLVDSVMRNREALAALVRMKGKSDYFFQHAVAVAVWSAILGRHLGLERQELVELAVAASMMDVGMTELPDALLSKPGGLNPDDRKQMQTHVRHSLKLIQGKNSVSNRVMNIIACHHERYDGSGYPRGLSGHDIPPLARVAGLVDTYDAMITDRPYAAPRTSFEAVQELSDAKDILFQGALIEQFVQTIGMFPTGSIVELNNGQVAVVVEQNEARRLRPKVMLVLDSRKKRLPQLTLLDLAACSTMANDQPSLWITQELRPGAHGLVPDEYFL